MLSERERRILKDTWRLATPLGDTVANLFYRRLFELRPEYRKLFPEEMSAQKRKLLAMLAFIVKATDWGVDQWDEDIATDQDLFMVVLALGRRHALLYKIPAEAYPVVGEALLWTLDMGLGAAFTEEARSAWVNLYGQLSAIMLMGTRNPQGVKP